MPPFELMSGWFLFNISSRVVPTPKEFVPVYIYFSYFTDASIVPHNTICNQYVL